MENHGKRKRKSASDDICGDTAFAVVLASLSSPNPHALRPLIKKCVNKLGDSITNPILSLLPTLLTFKSAAIASRAAEMVGSAALQSLDMNQKISSDADIVNGLFSVLGNSNTRLSVTACNVLLDLCTTSVGRRRLLESSALPRLLVGFLQIHKSSKISVCLCSVSGDNEGISSRNIGFKEDELPVLLLTAAIILINTCNIEQLEGIPTKLCQAFFDFMRNLWAKVRNEILRKNPFQFPRKGGDFYISNIRVSHMADTLFRLSICATLLVNPLPFHVIERGIFGFDESGFKDFVSNHWELSPFLVQQRLSEGDLVEEDDIFGLFVRLLNLVGNFPSFPTSMLPKMVSCFPIGSDKLNILNFLEEVKNKLGCPLIYEQDIRVLRTDNHLKREVHFFQDSLNSCCIQDPHYLSIEDVLKCEEAYKEGYSIALRGMEFRFESLAAIADGLASLFGQPSVGANMYLTPPNSQGLARHYDDHCVFVCQLVGTKQWKLFPQSNVQLPRLYDPLDQLHASKVQSATTECTHFLKEGDILYIPRGVPHEACTENASFDGSDDYSLHLTLGIEVEPPFEWEGFVHVAFFRWNKNKKQARNAFKSSSGIIHDISMNLLHAAICLIGDSDSTFQKACLVASNILQSHTHNWLDLNQRIIFRQLIDKVNTQSQFLEVFRSLELAIQRNKDPFDQIGWLRFLNLGEERSANPDKNMPFMGMKNLFSLCIQHKDKVEAAFQQLKSRSSSEVIFEDAIESYKMLLEKYRKARKRYMNGMVSLHYEI